MKKIIQALLRTEVGRSVIRALLVQFIKWVITEIEKRSDRNDLRYMTFEDRIKVRTFVGDLNIEIFIHEKL